MLNNYEQITEQIKKANSILITFPAFKNGEAIAGSLALYSVLTKSGKNVDILAKLNENTSSLRKPDRSFSFLPNFKHIKTSLESLKRFIISMDTSEAAVKQIKYKMEDNALKFFITPQEGNFRPENVSAQASEANFDLIITLNTPDMESLGEIYDENPELFYNTPIVNIDNDSANEEFGEINMVELTATSTAEILFNLFKKGFGEKIDENTATCLLSAIIYRTKNFKTLDVTPNTLKATSELISLGARREEIMNELYRSKSMNILKLWGRVLARLSGTEENKLIWSSLLKDDFIKTGSTKNDLGDIIEELIINIPDAEISVIFYEDPENGEEEQEPSTMETSVSPFTRALIYSAKNIDLKDVLAEYNPQGNKKIVELNLNSSLQEAKKEVVDHLQKKITELSL